MKQKGTICKILTYLRPYWLYVLLSFVFALLSVVLTLYAPILTGEAIDEMLAQGQVDFAAILHILKILVIVIAITSIAQWFLNLCNQLITYRVVRDIRRQAFEKLQTLPLSYVDQHPDGDLISRMITDVDQFSDGLLMGFTQLVTGIVSIVGTIFFMVRIHVNISLLVICLTPVSLFVASFVAKKTHSFFHAQSKTRAEMTSLVDEMVGNQKVVQTLGYGNRALERFAASNDKLQSVSLKAIFFSSITNPCTRFVNGLVYAGVGVYGAVIAMQGGITVGQLSCFLSYANQYTKPFNEISGVITELQNAFVCAKRVFDFLEEPSESREDHLADAASETVGAVYLQDVSFSYRKDAPLLQHLHVDVKPGQKIAIVGPTGCGKTTLINLLMRFYEVDEGAIFLDGCEIREMKRDTLRKKFGMVLQETWLKSGTIAENIAYGTKTATRQEIVEAAKAAHAHRFIMQMKDGYDTVIQEAGSNLSQGEKQLLCIARVILQRPPMLILDEATSSIDTRTEIQIQEAFDRLMEGRTSFIVAHRLSTIQKADLILVMKDGNLIEQGTHEQLLEQRGLYHALYESQFQYKKRGCDGRDCKSDEGIQTNEKATALVENYQSI